jgi:hypothetical protein
MTEKNGITKSDPVVIEDDPSEVMQPLPVREPLPTKDLATTLRTTTQKAADVALPLVRSATRSSLRFVGNLLNAAASKLEDEKKD